MSAQTHAAAERAPEVDPSPRAQQVALGLVATAGVALAVVVGRDGSPGWQLARVVTVALAAVLVAAAARSTAGRWSMHVLGLVALFAGAGIGLPHAVEAGVTMASVAGLVALASGMGLLVVSARSLTGNLAAWPRRLAIGVDVVLLAVLAWTLVPAVMATNVPHAELGSRTPADVGLQFEEVRFPSRDGFELSAWYVPSSNGAAVVVRHGAGSTRADVLDQAAVLAGGGFGVLLVDARGHGASEGRAMDFGWDGEDDIAASVDHLLTRSDVDPLRIGVLGSSMGGEEAIGALGDDDRIRAAVAEGATGRTASDNAWLSDEYGARGWVQEQLDRVRYALVDVLTDAPRPASLASSIVAARPRPVLLITAGDVDVEARAATHLASASPDTVQVWTVPGAGHVDGLATDPGGWEQRVLAFFEEHLAAGG